MLAFSVSFAWNRGGSKNHASIAMVEIVQLLLEAWIGVIASHRHSDTIYAQVSHPGGWDIW